MIPPTQTFRSNRYALVTAGHHFMLGVLPFRVPDSHTALARFVAAVECCGLASADVDAVLLRCLAALDSQGERRIPSLVDRYLIGASSAAGSASPSAGSVARFTTCIEDLMRHYATTDGSVQDAVEFIRRHFTDPKLVPQTVANHVGVRLATLDVAFRSQLHNTVTQHIRNARLERAAILLATTRKSIKETWASVGFNHHSNFDHDFKRQFGTSPRQFRERSIRPLAQRHYESRSSTDVPSSQSRTHSNRSVLIVDDDEGTRAILGAYLRCEGHTVSVAATGAEGLRLAERGEPDAILLDYHLDDMDGVGFLQTLRGDVSAEHTAVALFTADWDVLDRVDEVHGLNAIVVSKLCDADQVGQLIVYLSNGDPRSGGACAGRARA